MTNLKNNSSLLFMYVSSLKINVHIDNLLCATEDCVWFCLLQCKAPEQFRCLSYVSVSNQLPVPCHRFTHNWKAAATSNFVQTRSCIWV